jgi:D-alanyl-D-alanine carboxypeptidase (penicillin-binding protein 5/6)
MKKQLFCLLTLLCLLTLPVAAAPEQAVVRTVPDVSGMEVGAKAALVMEARTGRVLFAQNEQEKLPIASTTKIMTTLITLEQPNLDEIFEVDSNAIRVEGSSMGLREGDLVSLRALAVGMLLHSGNDAANAAAVRIAGSIPAFVEMMNQKAKELGMHNTSFETPSGLDGEHHYSTAYDMALLARHALEIEDFSSICSQYRMRTKFGNPPADRWLTNHNKLLNYYEGAYGVKTGFTKKAGRCLVSAAQRDGVELICVTLNCPNDWTVHRNLFDAFFPSLELVDLAQQLPRVQVAVTGGIFPRVEPQVLEEVCIPLPVKGTKLRYDVVVPPFLYAPVRKGDFLGEARVYLEEELVTTFTLTADRDVALLHPYEEKTSWWKRLIPSFDQ